MVQLFILFMYRDISKYKLEHKQEKYFISDVMKISFRFKYMRMLQAQKEKLH